MNRFPVIAGAFALSSCSIVVPQAAEPSSGVVDQKPTSIVLREAQHTLGSAIAQTLSPDAGALSILFDDLQANADPSKLGGAQLSGLIAIPIEGDAGIARISIDARGQSSSENGDCELALLTPSGRASIWSDADGPFVLNIAADVQVPFVFRIAINGLCWATKDESHALLAVDSLDIVIELPAQAASAGSK